MLNVQGNRSRRAKESVPTVADLFSSVQSHFHIVRLGPDPSNAPSLIQVPFQFSSFPFLSFFLSFLGFEDTT